MSNQVQTFCELRDCRLSGQLRSGSCKVETDVGGGRGESSVV
jgi:hypothetical protein